MADFPTPAQLGYRLPAEWETHAATWLSWPHNPATWPGKYEPIPAVWAQLARTLASSEPVHILAGGEAVMSNARALVGDVEQVTLHDIPTNDCWMRDHGPMFLVGPRRLPPALVDWQYNAWGGKYPPFDLDNEVPGRLAELLERRRYEVPIILEGGSIDGNGRGTLLATELCLLNPNRNPGLSRQAVENYLRDFAGVTHVLWLPGEGIEGDDTDGHIDELARFVDPRTVVAVVQEDPADPNHEPLADNVRRLRTMKNEAGQSLEVIPLPLPAPKYHEGQRLPTSYANFYIANCVVVVPQYDDPADRGAIETLARLFPSRQVIGLPALDLAWGLGAFHCITHEEPRVDLDWGA